MAIFLFVLTIGIALIASYFIYIIVRNRLIRSDNSNPQVISLIVAVVSFALITCTILFLIFVMTFSR